MTKGKKKEVKYNGEVGDDFLKLLTDNFPDQVKVYKGMDEFMKKGKDEFFDKGDKCGEKKST